MKDTKNGLSSKCGISYNSSKGILYGISSPKKKNTFQKKKIELKKRVRDRNRYQLLWNQLLE
jgi:hypothetical protein